jgi:hypothetical protein
MGSIYARVTWKRGVTGLAAGIVLAGLATVTVGAPAAQPAASDAGRPVIRRLTRLEYRNAVRDLLKIDVDASVDLPPDAVTDSFDNNGASLSMSPLLLEKYLRAARMVSRLATGDTSLPKTLYSFPTPDDQSVWHDGVPFGARGGPAVQHYFPVSGTYIVRAIMGNGHVPDVEGVRLFQFRTHVTAGSHSVAATIAAEYALPEGAVPQIAGPAGAIGGPLDPLRDSGDAPLLDLRLDGKRIERFEIKPPTLEDLGIPNSTVPGVPFVRRLEIDGPYDATDSGATASRARIFVCHPVSAAAQTACADRILTSLARRAFRRDVTSADVAPYIALYEKSRAAGDFEGAIREAIQAILVSPNFLFRVESDPKDAAVGQSYPLGDFQLASRLSFFLWSSIPDDHLLDLARSGRLHYPALLAREVSRMLADPKADALVDNFGTQYLGLQDLGETMPDAQAYPEFSQSLRDAYAEETRLFFRSFVRENRSVLDLVNADYSYLNGELARQYGVSGVSGDQFRRVVFKPGDVRGGVLTQGSVLLITSHANITSPVLRGKWIMNNLLNLVVPPPPPGVPTIQPTNASGRPLTGREQMEQHAATKVCASCHDRMDPLGFSMENFNVVGAWRTKDEAGPVDPAVKTTDGSAWTGAAGLKQYLLSRPDQLAQAFTARLMIYALGRNLERSDRAVVLDIVHAAAPGNYRFTDLIQRVVASEPFQKRRKDSQS